MERRFGGVWARWGASLAVAVVAAAAVGWWTVDRVEQRQHERVDESARAVARTARGVLTSWRDGQLEEVAHWAKEPVLRRHAIALLDSDHSASALLAHPSQTALRELLREPLARGGYRGMFVIARDGTNLASMRDNNVAITTLLSEQPELLQRVWAGSPVVSSPQVTDVPLGPGERADAPTMFSVAPIRDSGGQVVAALAFRIAPGAALSSLLAAARNGDTGETYLVDREGRLITRSRFEDALRSQGRLESDQSSIFHIRLVQPASGNPTLPAAALARGEAGSTVRPYRTYTGAMAVGAWLIDADTGIGIVSEQSADEAFAHLPDIRLLVAGGLLLITLAGFGLAYSQWRVSRRALTWLQTVIASQALARQAAHAAESSALSLEEAQRLAGIGSGVCDLQSGAVVWSATAVETLGPDLPSTSESLPELANRFAAGDRRAVGVLLEGALREPIEARLRAALPDLGDGARILQMRVRSTAGTGRAGRVVVSVQDTTQQDAVESAMHVLRERVHQISRAEAMGRLAGGIAHDFNNMLMVSLTCAELLAKELPAPSSARGHAETIREVSIRAGELTRQVLQLSRSSDLGEAATPLSAAIRQLGQLLRPALGERIELILELDDAVGSVQARAGEIDQIVMNLVVNARDALPAGGRIGVETHPVDGAVELVVWDDGIGMDAELVARAFERHVTTKPTRLGTGLGLATVKEIAERCGGSVAVRTMPGAGCRFTIVLPATAEALAPARDNGVSPIAGLAGRVLLVEDEATLRVLLGRVLRANGLVVVAKRSAEEALAWAESAAERVDLLVTDVVLPRMNGTELAARLRRLYPDLRVVMMSGYTAHAPVREATAQPGVAFIGKPFAPSRLLELIAALLETSAVAARA